MEIKTQLEYSYIYDELTNHINFGNHSRDFAIENALINYAFGEKKQEYLEVVNWIESYRKEQPLLEENAIKVITFDLRSEGLDFTIRDTGREPMLELSSYGYSEDSCNAFVYHWMAQEDFDNLEPVN